MVDMFENGYIEVHGWRFNTSDVLATLEVTRKLCYRKDDRAMRPIHGCPENFRDSLTTPTATIPNMGFCSHRPCESSSSS